MPGFTVIQLQFLEKFIQTNNIDIDIDLFKNFKFPSSSKKTTVSQLEETMENLVISTPSKEELREKRKKELEEMFGENIEEVSEND